MANQPDDRTTNLVSLPQRHSEQNPYNAAIYLHELIKAAAFLVDDIPAAQSGGVSVSALMTVIEERADALCRELDAGVLCEGWAALREAIEKDPKLGLGF